MSYRHVSHMDICMVIQHIWKGEEVACVEEYILLIKLVGGVWELVFFGACVHSRRGHNNFDYRKQSKRMISMSLVMR